MIEEKTLGVRIIHGFIILLLVLLALSWPRAR